MTGVGSQLADLGFAVVGVDSNVVSFDPSFRRDTGVASLMLILKIDKPPIKTELYARR